MPSSIYIHVISCFCLIHWFSCSKRIGQIVGSTLPWPTLLREVVWLIHINFYPCYGLVEGLYHSYHSIKNAKQFNNLNRKDHLMQHQVLQSGSMSCQYLNAFPASSPTSRAYVLSISKWHLRIWAGHSLHFLKSVWSLCIIGRFLSILPLWSLFGHCA